MDDGPIGWAGLPWAALAAQAALAIILVIRCRGIRPAHPDASQSTSPITPLTAALVMILPLALLAVHIPIVATGPPTLAIAAPVWLGAMLTGLMAGLSVRGEETGLSVRGEDAALFRGLRVGLDPPLRSDAPHQGGTVPASESGTAPATEGGTRPAPEGGTAPASEGGTAPASEGGTAPASDPANQPGPLSPPMRRGGPSPTRSPRKRAASSPRTLLILSGLLLVLLAAAHDLSRLSGQLFFALAAVTLWIASGPAARDDDHARAGAIAVTLALAVGVAGALAMPRLGAASAAVSLGAATIAGGFLLRAVAGGQRISAAAIVAGLGPILAIGVLGASRLLPEVVGLVRGRPPMPGQVVIAHGFGRFALEGVLLLAVALVAHVASSHPGRTWTSTAGAALCGAVLAIIAIRGVGLG